MTLYNYRFEQLGELLYQYFEVFFPWVLGTVVSWANNFLSADGLTNQFKSVPAYIRWGVGSVPAIELMANGLASRTLAVRIANSWDLANSELSILKWLRTLSLAQWQEHFTASATELRLLLDFCREAKGGAAAELITKERAEIRVQTNLSDFPLSAAIISPIDNSEFSDFGVWVEGDLVGTIGSKDHAEIHAIQSSGLAYAAKFLATSDSGLLRLELINPD